MNPLFHCAVELQRFFEARAWRFCFIGGLAVQRWGEPRLTLDVDCTLVTGFGNERPYIEALLGAFEGRMVDAGDFALAHRVLLLFGPGRVPIDVALGAMPFEEGAVERASSFNIGGEASILTCSAEDLIVFKVFAGRARDWLDVEGIIERQARALAVGLIWQELIPLLELKEDAESGPRLRRLLEPI